MKNSSDTIGKRTRDLPACSLVPSTTAPPRAPGILKATFNVWTWLPIETLITGV
jgi:hypothetical protein